MISKSTTILEGIDILQLSHKCLIFKFDVAKEIDILIAKTLMCAFWRAQEGVSAAIFLQSLRSSPSLKIYNRAFPYFNHLL